MQCVLPSLCYLISWIDLTLTKCTEYYRKKTFWNRYRFKCTRRLKSILCIRFFFIYRKFRINELLMFFHSIFDGTDEMTLDPISTRPKQRNSNFEKFSSQYCMKHFSFVPLNDQEKCSALILVTQVMSKIQQLSESSMHKAKFHSMSMQYLF